MRWRTGVVYPTVCVGGVAALSWEVVWQLRIAIAVGISAVGTAITLACLMGGMTAGSLLAGRWLRGRTIAQPLRLYGALELLIGLAGLLLGPAFALLEQVDSRVFAVAPAAAPLVHLVGVASILAVPTLAMGASLPLFALVARAHDTSIGLLYGSNTLGAAIGVLLSAFVLLPWWGVGATSLIIAALNVAVFVAALLLSAERTASLEEPADTPDAEALGVRQAAALAFVTGAATFAIEVVWFRALRSAFWSTTASFAVMLFAVLVSLALAARLAPYLERRVRREGLPLVIAGALVLLATPVVERFDLLPAARAVGHPTVARLVACLLVLGPPIVFLGVLLPWLLNRQRTASRCARVYAANTLGAIVGALAAAWLLLPALGVARSSWLIGAMLLGAGTPLLERRGRPLMFAVGLAALAVAVRFDSGVGRERVIGLDFYGPHRVLAFQEGPDVTTSVAEVFGQERGLFIDGFAAAGEWGATRYMEWMGRLPMLAHPAPRDVLVICFGTGQTANAVRREGAARVRIVDVNPVVYETARWFPKNEEVLADPRVEPRVMDGRAWLRRSGERYDVVTLEPMPPNHAGVNSLYSVEFYELVRDALHDGGVAAQWLPAHLVTRAHAGAIAATFQAVFPDAILWMHPEDRNGILLGRKRGTPGALGRDWPGFGRAPGRRSLSADAVRDGVLLSAAGLRRYGAGAPLVTDDNQLLAYGAAWDIRASGARPLDLVHAEFLAARDPERGTPGEDRRARQVRAEG